MMFTVFHCDLGNMMSPRDQPASIYDQYIMTPENLAVSPGPQSPGWSSIGPRRLGRMPTEDGSDFITIFLSSSPALWLLKSFASVLVYFTLL